MPRDDDSRREQFRAQAAEAPRITALTDAPLAVDEAFRDRFNLRYWLGPVYDIVRHPQTRTPLTVAVYGAWGAGKTTAMRWLEGMLAQWNELPVKEAPVKVRTVWFFPWKYQSREDVWRGLIAEVILESLALRNADVHTVGKAARQFGLFLGQGFLHVLAGLKVKTPAGEMGLSGIEKILEESRQLLRPEKAYLNEFEATLRSWIGDTLGPDDRMLIFIDDLDRCLPQVALEVLEALKLYLNLGQLIFVVGVDRPVIDQLVQKHYRDLGLSEDKSRQYLQKMFQIEVDLSPSAGQIERYLDDHLDRLPHWSDQLSAAERKVFRGVILELGGRNPREIKRLINSATMRGVGAEMTRAAGSEIGFREGLQLFFVRRRLQQRHPRQSFLVGHPRGDEFFGLWSQQLRGTEVPDEALRAERFADQQPLLDDALLAQLMGLPYPEDTSTAAEAAEIDVGLLHYIAEALGKAPEALTRREYFNVKELDLRTFEISDLAPLVDFGALRRLNLAGARVSDLSPLRGLGALRWLNLTRTEIDDVAPLAGLTALEELGLAGTGVRDATALRRLEALRVLNLSATSVTDLAPLKGLVQLEKLYLAGTEVTDLSPLRSLSGLRRLDLSRTSVNDLSPLVVLSGLRKISLQDVVVADQEIRALTRALPEVEIER